MRIVVRLQDHIVNENHVPLEVLLPFGLVRTTWAGEISIHFAFVLFMSVQIRLFRVRTTAFITILSARQEHGVL